MMRRHAGHLEEGGTWGHNSGLFAEVEIRLKAAPRFAATEVEEEISSNLIGDKPSVSGHQL